MRKLLIITALIILLLQPIFLASAWEVERPYRFDNIDNRTDSSYTNGEASVGIGVAINEYIEDYSEYSGSDVISMNLTMSANSRRGITYDYYWWGNLLWYNVYGQTSIVGDDAGAWIDIPQDPYTFEFRFYGGWLVLNIRKFGFALTVLSALIFQTLQVEVHQTFLALRVQTQLLRVFGQTSLSTKLQV